VHILLPCATITTAQTFTIASTAQNTYIEGCGYNGAQPATPGLGGTVFNYTGSASAFQVGDPTHANHTSGFKMTGLSIYMANASPTAVGLSVNQTWQMHLEDLFIMGNNTASQTGMYLDGTGQYTNGYFANMIFRDIGTGIYLTGNLTGLALSDYVDFSTFIDTQIWCADNGGVLIPGTIGVNDVGSVGNTWIGGGAIRCSTPWVAGAGERQLTSNGFNTYNVN
jgi:hypothetical protein